jgi:serine/threonine-protein kinase HipA
LRAAKIFLSSIHVADFREISRTSYELEYKANYKGYPISLTLPVKMGVYSFNQFPTFFDGLLPEGGMLEALLKTKKIDRYDYFSQLMAVGGDLVGAVTMKEITNE